MDLLSLGKEPISADRPTGSDIRYDPSFEVLQLEMDKISSPSAAGSVDWEKVVGLSSEILSQKAKDLLVSGYFAVALIHTRQIDGLAIGTKVYHDLLERFWDDLYPPKTRVRGRMGAIEWWVEKTVTALKQLPKTPVAQDRLDQLHVNFEKIDQLLRDKLEDPPLLGPIFNFFSSAAARKQEESIGKDPAEARTGGESPAGAADYEGREKGELAEISSPQEVKRLLSSALAMISEAATYFWQQDLSNPLLYRMDRIALWSSIESLPPATKGRTRIPPPSQQIKESLEELRTKGESEALLRGAEEKLPQFIFWLDLNRLVADALGSLGDPFQEAHLSVCQETAYFNHRLPGLENLSFSDGTPFADHETRQWLKEIAFRVGPGTEESVSFQEPGSTPQKEELIRKEMQEAHTLIKQKKLLEAVERLQGSLRNCVSEKERLLWRLAITQLFINTKNPKLVLSHLEKILEDIDRFRLEEYDPLLALKCLKLVWTGFSYQSNQVYKEKAAETLKRIGKLDMAEVIRLEKG